MLLYSILCCIRCCQLQPVTCRFFFTNVGYILQIPPQPIPSKDRWFSCGLELRPVVSQTQPVHVPPRSFIASLAPHVHCVEEISSKFQETREWDARNNDVNPRKNKKGVESTSFNARSTTLTTSIVQCIIHFGLSGHECPRWPNTYTAQCLYGLLLDFSYPLWPHVLIGGCCC